MRKAELTWLNKILIVICLLAVLVPVLSAQDRFPRPEFEVEYDKPLTTTPAPRNAVWTVIDLAVLVIAMSLASWLALKKRSRRHLFILMLFSVIWFGFIRRGCICSVGSIQNIALALGDAGYAIPLSVILFFSLPLVFTLFFGRSFCAAVCPLGGIQDLVLLKPKKLPDWLNIVLSILPAVYLGLAVLFASTGAAFLICRYDPFIGIFRFTASFGMLVFGIAFLVLSVFIGRPYCRFLCPYGVILGWFSKLSKYRVTITPAECVQCRLCEESCPFDAIQKPTPDKTPETRRQGVRRLGLLILLFPVMMAAGGWSVSMLDNTLAQVHPRVRLAQRIQLEDAGLVTGTTLESRTFRSQGIPVEQLMDETATIRQKMHTGGWVLGLFIGLIVASKLIALSIRRKRTDYEADREFCVACGRCFETCPVERETWPKAATIKTSMTGDAESGR